MAECICIIQRNSVSSTKKEDLTRMLTAFAKSELRTELSAQWIAVAEGSGFNASDPSRTSFVSITLDRAVEQPERARLLSELCKSWSDVTGCSLDEILAIVADPTPV